jgi:16S rRNA (guanine527-N7)-methyltransferase
MELIRKYFPGISNDQLHQLQTLSTSLKEWNEKINVVSRKDIDMLEERHILHSLAIAKFISFTPGTSIIDVGTGGGFPGLPLAILFPDCKFTLVDSIAKKIKVVGELTAATGLRNVHTLQARIESVQDKFDFVVSRAVTAFPQFYRWTAPLISGTSANQLPNGMIYLKGGNLSGELSGFGKRVRTEPISQWFDEAWFEEKKIVYLNI